MEYTPYSSSLQWRRWPTRKIEDEEEYTVYSITRRRGGTQWIIQCTHPLFLVMEYPEYSSSSWLRKRPTWNIEDEEEYEYDTYSIARIRSSTPLQDRGWEVGSFSSSSLLLAIDYVSYSSLSSILWVWCLLHREDEEYAAYSITRRRWGVCGVYLLQRSTHPTPCPPAHDGMRSLDTPLPPYDWLHNLSTPLTQ